MTKRWAVAGGGMLGMAMAYRLARAGCEVELVEAAPELGGLASAWEAGGITWDRHYHVILYSDFHTRGLLAELGLERELVWKKTRTAFLDGGKLHPMTTAWDFLRFPPLSLWGKARLAATILYASRLPGSEALERVTAVDWLERLSGRKVVERLWRPLLESKLGDSAGEVAASFIHATIARLYSARRSGLKEELFGYLPGGYARIADAMLERLRREGVTVRTATPIREVRSEDGGVRLVTGGGALEADAVVLTVPAPLVAQLCPDLPEGERRAFAGVRYQGIVCAAVVLDAPLSDNYVTNLGDRGLPFTGVIDMTALVDPTEFGGKGLVYLPKYAGPDERVWGESDQQIEERFLDGLGRVYCEFDRGSVEAFRVSRVRHVFALPVLRRSEHLPPMRTSAAGMFAVNSAHILNGTLNVNETLRLANAAASWILAAGGRPPEPSVPAAHGWGSFWKEAPVPARLRRWEVEYFLVRAERLLDPKPDDLVLDIGSGAGLLAELLAPRVREVHCLDLSAVALDQGRIALAGRDNVFFHQLDGQRYTNLNVVGERRFSLIVCLSALQYYRSAEEVADLLREVRRVAEPGARMLIADLPVREGPAGDALDLLRAAGREGRLPEACEFLLRAATSGQRGHRRQLGLTLYSREILQRALDLVELDGEILETPLTQFPGRLHMMVRFGAGREGE